MKLVKEPIKNGKLWIVLGVLFFLSVPWYLPTGSYKPMILGLPYWAWIILLDTLALSITLTIALKKLWITETDKTEEGEE